MTNGKRFQGFKVSRFRGLLFVVWVLVLVSSSFASSSLTDNTISLGYIKAGSSEVGAISWQPDFRLGMWGVGLDINIPVGNNKPEGYDTVVFRYAEFNDGMKGLRYGLLDGYTWGHGLLMKNYSSRNAGPIAQNNNQTAFKGYFNAERVGIEFFTTWSHLYGLRLTERAHQMLILGQSYISDADGVSVKNTDGTTTTYPSVSGLAIDASVPLPMNFIGYTETAALMTSGNSAIGSTIGINWGFNALAFAALFDVGYRVNGKNFVPGYFNGGYETNPINLISYEASSKEKNGYIAELNLLFSTLLQTDVIYEYYNGSDAVLNGKASAKYDKYTASAYFEQPKFTDFRSLNLEQGAIIGMTVGYDINDNMTLFAHYKKAYDPNVGQVIESQYYEVKLGF
ncbi:hypothetical protein A2230_03070 [candidate division WOR-1 bacterium RIFOXYA2_FULL_36_21]|uniref:Uncharacterized protein n=1 Tax=candidate division WOR-1 bacterium RIFOXYB2_FULL_36_35 TaxID=1802578 RepID=A0A1F4S0V1_UNCSA|nr:MAG: hypothetical protein A2230_03070 [candidate division WOR-1 bacterium RIFOXYA2_FULL_36_21]OGC14062.1 MAG: hypothetical protein A2290_06995 [candidate division WOR-1 bacterium RIFOXYB2_FULL_36_35]OGC16761.1 MAG: hypothetical protein A2282_04090 [candidate division WOR-1 bacterium RIFOXYA12_FULL_36_13]